MSKKHMSSDYAKTNYPGLKIHKNSNRHFLFDFRVSGKRYRQLYTVKATNHSKRDNINEALIALEKKKDRIKGAPNPQGTMDSYFYQFMSVKKETDWNKKLVRYYNLYIGTCELFGVSNTNNEAYDKFKIGHMKINTIKLLHLEKIKKNMIDLQLKERTQNLIFEVLNPFYKWLVSNNILEDNIAKNIKEDINVAQQKRVVVNPQKLLKELHSAIHTLYQEDPFYRAMFLFFTYGRRKMEVLKLKWSHIDFENNRYILAKTKSGKQQTFTLPGEIKEALQQIAGKKRGYVFKSPIRPGMHIANIDRQTRKLKERTTDEFTIHYCRHILVSALSLHNINKNTLGNLLGHIDSHSIDRYVSENTEAACKFVQPVLENIFQKAA